MTKITDTLLRRLKQRPPDKQKTLVDGQVEGLEVRVSPKGTISWSLRYRVKGHGPIGKRGRPLSGPQKRNSLGRYPSLGVKQARAMASEYLLQAEQGNDPFKPTTKEADLLKQQNQYTIGDLVTRFFADYAQHNLKPSTIYRAKSQINAHVIPRWINTPISEITKPIAAQFILDVSKKNFKTGRGGPSAAADVKKWMHRIFSWANEIGLTEVNPFHGLKNPVKLHSRDRVLSMDELITVWNASDELGYPWGPAFRLLILTASRRSEWLGMRWCWISMEEKQVKWPAKNYKSNRVHTLPITDKTGEILAKLPRWKNGDYLFTSTEGEKPVSSFSKAKKKMDAIVAETSNVSHWTIHDIRRSVATHMARIGVDEIVIERLLGHSIQGVKGVYNRYRYFEEIEKALKLWEAELLNYQSKTHKNI